jgi:hypothetical protein
MVVLQDKDLDQSQEPTAIDDEISTSNGETAESVGVSVFEHRPEIVTCIGKEVLTNLGISKKRLAAMMTRARANTVRVTMETA